MSKALATQSINDKVRTFAQLKEKRTQVANLQKELDAKYNALREDLRQVMSERKVLTLKTEEYTLSRSTRRVVRITDHDKLIAWFEKRGEKPTLKVDYYSALPAINSAFKAKQAVSGAEENSAEYVSVRLNKRKGGE